MNKKMILILAIAFQSFVSHASQDDMNKMMHIVASAHNNDLPIARQPFSKPITIFDPSRIKHEALTNIDFGVATSSTQTEESSGKNTWTPAYFQTIPGKENTPTPGFAAQSWSEWENDINQLLHLGVKAYRFSIEWSRIQPSKDTFDQSAIDHYITICQKLQEHNIKPLVCLHHYSDPIWFMEQGGFTEPHNIKLFTHYCQTMYHTLAPYVEQWIVISQPAAYALKSYKTGSQPPCAKDSGLEAQVMMNLFRAHINVYDYMHNQFNINHIGKKPQVGLSHQLVQMLPSNEGTLFSSLLGKHTLEQTVAYFADRLNNQMILQTFTTGYFPSMFPGKTIGYLPDAPGKFDFFALSYYSPLAFSWITPQPPHTTPDRQAGDNFRIIDEQGLYDAIKQVSVFGKPIYIVETGITPRNEDQRKLFLNAYLSATAQAIEDGFDVKGFYYWTLKNNYEWNQVNDTFRFGLYNNIVQDHATGRLHPEYKNHELMLTDGGKHYKNIIKKQRENHDTIA